MWVLDEKNGNERGVVIETQITDNERVVSTGKLSQFSEISQSCRSVPIIFHDFPRMSEFSNKFQQTVTLCQLKIPTTFHIVRKFRQLAIPRIYLTPPPPNMTRVLFFSGIFVFKLRLIFGARPIPVFPVIYKIISGNKQYISVLFGAK